MADVDESAQEPGLPLATDPLARGDRPDLPAFLAPPAGAPVYYGFPVLDDFEVDGFRLGMITDFEAVPSAWGDAFVVAPDGSRAGLVWEVSPERRFEEIRPPEAGRWGVWAVAFPHPMDNRRQARRNLEALLPELRERWERWKASGDRSVAPGDGSGPGAAGQCPTWPEAD